MANINPENNQVPPLCPNCQDTMVLKEKEGSQFYGCPNWQECGSKTIPVGGYKKRSYGSPSQSTNPVQSDQLKEGMKIMNENIVALDKKMTTLHKKLDTILEIMEG